MPQDAFLETLGDWPELTTVLAVEAIRRGNGSGKVEAESRYFLSSSAGDPPRLAQAIRRHGSIENRLHWVLDVLITYQFLMTSPLKAGKG